MIVLKTARTGSEWLLQIVAQTQNSSNRLASVNAYFEPFSSDYWFGRCNESVHFKTLEVLVNNAVSSTSQAMVHHLYKMVTVRP